MKTSMLIAGLMATSVLAVASVAQADDDDYASSDDSGRYGLLSRYGMSVFVGGGVGGFTDEAMRDLTGTAGVWEARVNFGTLLPIAIEAAYAGGAQSIDTLGLDPDAVLLTTTLEGNARLNILPTSMAQPYIFAGLGWSRFSLTRVNTNTSSVEDDDDTLVVPLGVGVAFRISPFLIDVRGTYRPTFYEDLVPQANNRSEGENLDSWTAALRAGFEF